MGKIKPRKTGIDDVGFKRTDKALEELESRLSSLYTKSGKEMEQKLGKYMKQYEAMDKKKLQMVSDGLMTEAEYKSWREGQMFMSAKTQAQIDSIAEDLMRTDVLADEMINGTLPSIYASNYNFEVFKAETMCEVNGIEFKTNPSFTIYNADAVSSLAQGKTDILPAFSKESLAKLEKKVDIPKDLQWNREKVASALQQGIVQGDSIDDIAKRLRDVTSMDYEASVRNARTGVIGAQNSGRSDASDRMKEAGNDVVDVWSCTYDGRTRDTHLALDGQERGEDGYFTTYNGDKLEYPCDPSGDPAEVYNCRCRLNTIIRGIDHSKDDDLYEKFMQENFYDDWLEQKERESEKYSNAYVKNLEKDYAKERSKEMKKKY